MTDPNLTQIFDRLDPETVKRLSEQLALIFPEAELAEDR